MPIERFDPAKPYNALPPLPPKVDLESRTILRDCIGARATLAELKQAGDLLPTTNPKSRTRASAPVRVEFGEGGSWERASEPLRQRRSKKIFVWHFCATSNGSNGRFAAFVCNGRSVTC